MVRRILGVALAALLLLPGGARAADIALFLTVGRYEQHPPMRATNRLLDLRAQLADNGYEVITLSDLNRNALFAELPAAVARAKQADRIVIVIAGQIVSSPRDSFLLTRDAGVPNAFRVGSESVSIGALLDVASLRRDMALVVVADGIRPVEIESGLTDGFAPSLLPEGITVLSGPALQLSDFLAGDVLIPGTRLEDAIARMPSGLTADAGGPLGVLVSAPPAVDNFEENLWRLAVAEDSALGYETYLDRFPRGRYAAEARAALDRLSGGSAGTLDEFVWQEAERLGTPEAYRDYLSRFPRGRFADEAARRIQRLEQSPVERAARMEDDLGLTRQQRRAIQGHLQVLGYYDLGIDGLFGAGTRNAIAGWQRANGFEVTGYITGNQLTLLDRQGTARAEELRAEEEAQDRRYWAQTGRGRDEDGLRAYLERFPEGLYSEIAQRRLAAIEEQRRLEREARDRTAWQAAEAEGTVAAYQRYLEAFPEGLFAEAAEEAIARLDPRRLTPAERQRAEARERSLGLDATARRLVEMRLRVLGLAPGNPDGVFDGTTRDAIWRYQETRGMRPTGYLDQGTLVRLVAEVIFQ